MSFVAAQWLKAGGRDVTDPTQEPTPQERASELKAIAETLTLLGGELTKLERRVRRLRCGAWRGVFEMHADIELDAPAIEPATGDQLAERRRRLGLSQRAVAKRVYVSRGLISDVESGRRPSPQLRRQIEILYFQLEAQRQ